MKIKILGYTLIFGSIWLFCWLLSLMPEDWFGNMNPWWIFPLFATEAIVCVHIGVTGFFLTSFPTRKK